MEYYEEIKPKETRYNGYKFRSRLEARWAVFFDVAGIKYQYEPDTYEFDGCSYLPDFFLPTTNLRSNLNSNVFIEIKPNVYKEDSDFYHLFTLHVKKPLILIKGTPWDDCHDYYDGYSNMIEFSYSGPFGFGWDMPMFFFKCYECGLIKIDYPEGNYMYCPACNNKSDFEHPDFAKARQRAKEARFEWGQNG